MNNSAHFSFYAPSFAGRTLPESGYIVGYAAIIQKLGLQMPIPRMIAMITTSSKKYVTKDLRNFPKSYLPDDNTTLSEINALYNHLIFAYS